MVDFGDTGVVFIEVKYTCNNEPDSDADWPPYLEQTTAFEDADAVRDTGLYELARNWRVAWEFRNGRPMNLVNLGLPKLFRGNAGRRLQQFVGGLSQAMACQFVKVTWARLISLIPKKPDWLDEYISERGLA
jgi:hypothetical protein